MRLQKKHGRAVSCGAARQRRVRDMFVWQLRALSRDALGLASDAAVTQGVKQLRRKRQR
jgi:hypothetical protein